MPWPMAHDMDTLHQNIEHTYFGQFICHMQINFCKFIDILDGTSCMAILHVQNYRTFGHRILCIEKETKSNHRTAYVSSYIDANLWFHRH